MKHSFTTFADSRTLIGPVGVPFGFLVGGHYELTVYDFELNLVEHDKHKKGVIHRTKPFFLFPGKHSSSGSGSGNADTAEDLLKHGVEAGFYLQQFSNEADFEKYLESIRENTTACIFDAFREHEQEPHKKDVLGNDDDDAYAAGAHAPSIPSAKPGILLSMKSHKKTWRPNTPTIEYTFQQGEAGLYFLVYQVCIQRGYQDRVHLENIRSSFELDFHFRNYDAFGHANYLTAGEMHLPLIFFFFSMSYLVCLIIWAHNIYLIGTGQPGHFAATTTTGASGKPVVYPIHHLMTVLLLFKFLSIFFESVRYHGIRVSGHAEAWSVIYYLLTFVKGFFLFTVILLIGSGWSFVKPFLSTRERNVVALVLVLQVINNLALTFMARETEGERNYQRWSGVLHMVDILCCCAVLFPIVWQIKSLEKSIAPEEDDSELMGDGSEEGDHARRSSSSEQQQRQHKQQQQQSLDDVTEKGPILVKLRQLQNFYLLVAAYIYSTRILVYLFTSMLSYKRLWVRHFSVELVTLTFYVIVGIMFRPMTRNPYLTAVRTQDDGDDAEDNHGVVELERIAP